MPRTRSGETYLAQKEERMDPPEGRREDHANKTVGGEHERVDYGENGLCSKRRPQTLVA